MPKPERRTPRRVPGQVWEHPEAKVKERELVKEPVERRKMARRKPR